MQRPSSAAVGNDTGEYRSRECDYLNDDTGFIVIEILCVVIHITENSRHGNTDEEFQRADIS